MFSERHFRGKIKRILIFLCIIFNRDSIIMSSYEISRFVDLSLSDAEELTCSICQDIFRNPVVTKCCLQIFCEQYINDWLSNNNNCPFDRKPLKISHLSHSARYKKFNKIFIIYL
jgi:hypothetical protein